jgi:transposase
MRLFHDVPEVYLHKAPVDFRKSINGLVALVEHAMAKSPFSGALYVFSNHRSDKLKVVYWDQTGFCLWYKRLEKQRFAWPKTMDGDMLSLNEEQFHWLLRGLDISRMRAHPALSFQFT